MAHGDFPDRRDMRFGGNMERANVGKPNVSVNWGGRDVPGVDLRYENYRAPYRAEYSPSRNPHHPSHANRTDYMAQGYNSRGELQNYPSRRNMRGKDSYSINVGPRPERDTTGLGGLINRLDTGNIGFTDILNLNPFMKLWPQSWLDAVGEDRYFNQDRKDWNDKYYGKADTGSGQMFNQRGISSERQPGLEGGMGGGLGGLQEQAGLWQDIKRILKNTKNPGPLIDQWTDHWMKSQRMAGNDTGIGSTDEYQKMAEALDPNVALDILGDPNRNMDSILQIYGDDSWDNLPAFKIGDKWYGNPALGMPGKMGSGWTT